MTENKTLPFGAEIDAEHVWCQVLTKPARPLGRPTQPALFLDSDGVIVEEVHSLHKVEEARLVPGATDAIRRANDRGIPVVMVTNQAGIGRGIYGWPEFIAVQDRILDDLADAGAFINAVFACPHHDQGRAPYDAVNHEARKPNPGMLTRADARLGIDMAASWIVGDRAGDVGAGRNAGLAGGIHVLSGHGKDADERSGSKALASSNYRVLTADSIADAWPQIPLLVD